MRLMDDNFFLMSYIFNSLQYPHDRHISFGHEEYILRYKEKLIKPFKNCYLTLYFFYKTINKYFHKKFHKILNTIDMNKTRRGRIFFMSP